MGEFQDKNHFFESEFGSGALVYVIDNNEPVCLKFSQLVKIQVLFDDWSKIEVEKDLKCQDLECVSIQDQVGVLSPGSGGAASVDVIKDCKIADNDDLDEVNRESKHEILEQISYSEKSRHKQKILKGAKKFTELEDSGFCKRVLRNTTVQSTKYVSSSKKKEKDRQEGDGCDPVSNCMSSNPAEKSDLMDKVCRKNPNRVVKLNVKLPSANNTAKVTKSLLKSKIRKKAAVSKKYLVKKVRSPDIKSENTEELNLQGKEKLRKLLIEKAIKCEYCMVVFTNQQTFYDHRRVEESLHKCGICGKVEPYEAHLIVHMQKHRRVKVETASNRSGKANSSTELLTDSANVKCSDGKKSKKEKMVCNVCGLVVSSMDSLKIHTFLHTGEHAYRCCVCGEHFSSLSSRQHHMDIHVSAQRFKCNPCGERFTSRAELAKHQLTHEIKCALCGEIFPNKTSRTCHFRVSHPDDILKCSLCSNLFAVAEDLEKHMAYHKKGKKEQCPVCGLVVSKLKDHMLMHSQLAQEKLYACDQCPMRYLRKSNLDRHMRTHTGEKPYACNKCPKSFRSNGMLRKHLLTHTKERPYQCEVCGKQCSLRSNLNIHMRVHNSDRHFACALCSQAFNHKNSLHGHMKNKHAQGMNMQENKLNTSAKSQLQPRLMSSSDMVSEMDKHFQNIHIPVGMSAHTESEKHQTYREQHPHMEFVTNMSENISASLFIDSDRISLNKYDLHLQTSNSHGY